MDFIHPYFDTTISRIVILGILTLMIIFSNLIKKKSNATRKAKLAPLVPSSWPLIGHFPILSSPNLRHMALASLADKYGPIFTLRLGIRYCVLVVSSSELTKEIFTMNDGNVSFRSSSVSTKYVGYDHALFPFTPSSQYWREMRKFSTSEFLSNHHLGTLKYIRIQEVKSSIKELYDKGGRIVEMKQWLGSLNMNVLLRIIIGKKKSLFVDEKEKKLFEEECRETLSYLATYVLRDAVPFLGWIDLGGHEKRMKKIAKELDDILGKWLDEHKKKRLLGEDKEDKDFMDTLISFLDGKNLEGYDADTITKATCMVLIASNISVAVALTWAILLLLNNKNVLKKAQEELDIHVGKERMVNDKDINNLVYLQAIIKESLRLHPPAYIPTPRKFSEDCTIGGYHIPKDTWLMINLWKIHKDPNVWPNDPSEFKPERFLTNHKEVDVKGKHFELFPFGGGRRACPATSYGLQMMHFTLANLLHAFEISTPNNELIDISSMKVTHLEILASPRLPSNCFEEGPPK